MPKQQVERSKQLARLAISAARLASLLGLRWLSRRAVDAALALAPWEDAHRR